MSNAERVMTEKIQRLVDHPMLKRLSNDELAAALVELVQQGRMKEQVALNLAEARGIALDAPIEEKVE